MTMTEKKNIPSMSNDPMLMMVKNCKTEFISQIKLKMSIKNYAFVKTNFNTL